MSRLHAPVVVRYDRPGWVPALLADPTGPGLGPPELWGYFVPPLSDVQVHRTRFPVPQPAAFAPLSKRFYAVVTELDPPRPDAQVRLVIRRERYEVVPGPRLLGLARRIAADTGAQLRTEDLLDVLFAEAFIPPGRRLRYRQLMRRRGARRRRQAWIDPVGWQPISAVWHLPQVPGEREYPMWRRPDPVRNQWFGSLPTDAPDPDDPDLKWTYRLHCVARSAAPAGKPFCPPGFWVSAPGGPFRIAPLRMPATGG